MSYNVRVEIVCDHGACTNRIAFRSVNSGGLNKTDAGINAEKHGWDIGGGGRDPKLAYCPEHRRPSDRPHPARAQGIGGWEHVGDAWWSTCMVCGRSCVSRYGSSRWRHEERPTTSGAPSA